MAKQTERCCQTYPSIWEYYKSYILVPLLFGIVGLIIRCLQVGWEAAVNEMISVLRWGVIPALVGFVAVFLWHYIKDPYVEVQVSNVQTRMLDYYESQRVYSIEGGGWAVTACVTLLPSKPVQVENIVLQISGKCFDSAEITIGGSVPFAIRKTHGKESYTLRFHIPKVFGAVSRKVRIVATANKIKRPSKPFEISFGDANGQTP